MISRSKRVFPFVAVIAMLTGFVAAGAIPASAASISVNCSTDNLQTKINAAGVGDTLVISGTCVGNFIVNNKLTLSGMPGATLDGGGVDTTLVTNAAKVKVTGLMITGGVHSSMSFGGGGILNFGTLSISHSTVSGNSVTSIGGSGGGILNWPAATLIISNSTVSGNSANNAGGGILNQGTLTISGSALNGNAGQMGGGIYNDGVVSMSTSTMSGNNAVLFGGAILNNLPGNVTISASTFSGNLASLSGGAIDNRGDLTISTSTLNKNKAQDGGAIRNVDAAATITMTASTVAGNAADDGGGIDNFTGTTIVGSSIVADNTATTVGNDCTGGPTSNGYNLVGDADGCSFVATTGDQVGSASGSGEIDPLIGPLASNGGPTQTMRLGLSSPAVDTIPPATALCPTSGTKDQRGTARPQGINCDIGAYELTPWISRVTVDSGTAAGPSVSGTIACQSGTPFTISLTLKQGPSSGTGSTSGTCGGSAPVVWTASVSGTFAPGVAQVSYKSAASTAKEKGKLQVVLA